MLYTTEVAIEPGVNPQAREALLNIHDKLLEELRGLYDESAAYRLACFQAVNRWMEHEVKYPDFKFGSLLVALENRGSLEAAGIPDIGQDTLVVKHKDHPQVVLGLDVAGYLFKFNPIDRATAVIGSRRFFEEAYTRSYQTKYPGTTAFIPGQERIWTPEPVALPKVALN